jgi:hypothetical protein
VLTSEGVSLSVLTSVGRRPECADKAPQAPCCEGPKGRSVLVSV